VLLLRFIISGVSIGEYLLSDVVGAIPSGFVVLDWRTYTDKKDKRDEYGCGLMGTDA
jgi:hypothetical protein